MKIVHVCTQATQGGAARATVNLHIGLRQLGAESTVLSLSEPGVIPYGEHYPYPETYHSVLKEISLVLIWKNRTEISNTHFSIDLFGCNISDHPLVRQADVINLHWIAGFLSSVAVAELAALGKPIVWTVHDMRPLTGGCHFSGACDRFATTCGHCPQLRQEPLELTTQSLNAMASAVAMANPVFIAPSQWMQRNIQKSHVSKKSMNYCIPYGVDSECFQVLEKDACRSELSIQKDAWYLLLTTCGFLESRKGMDHALCILNQVRKNPATAEAVRIGKMRLLLCGADASRFVSEGWQVDCLGYVHAEKMPLVYNSANVLLFTSLDDNLPNVILEAMACGLPILAHAIGGVTDLLEGEKSSGRLFQVGDINGAASSIADLFQNQNLYDELSFHAIEKIKCFYSLEKQASAYLQLYTNLISKHPTQSSASAMVIREGSSHVLPLAINKIKARCGHRLNKKFQNQVSPKNASKKFAEFAASSIGRWCSRTFLDCKGGS